MNRKLKFFWCSLILVLSLNQVNAQAFDGQDDYKIFLGYLNVGGQSGLELQYDYGWNNIISTGGKIQLLLKAENPNEYEEVDGFDKIDLGIFLRGHLSNALNLPSNFDPYLGVDFSLKSIGAHAGAKYSFGEIFGLYAQVSPSLFSSFVTSEGDFYNFYTKKVAVSGGLTVYF